MLTLKKLAIVFSILLAQFIVVNGQTEGNTGVIEDICIFNNEYGKGLRVGFHPFNKPKVTLYIPESAYSTDLGYFKQMHAQLLEAATNKRTVDLYYVNGVINLINTTF